jgi:hypothetical protein
MTENNKPSDRRNQPRFPMRAYAQLAYSTREWEVHVLDMSMTGARIALLSEHLLRAGDNIKLFIDSDEIGLQEASKKKLQLHGQIVHIRDHLVGIEHQPTTEMDKQLLVLLLAQTDDN